MKIQEIEELSRIVKEKAIIDENRRIKQENKLMKRAQLTQKIMIDPLEHVKK